MWNLSVGRLAFSLEIPPVAAEATRSALRPAGGEWGPRGEFEVSFDEAKEGTAVRLGEVAGLARLSGNRAVFSPPPRTVGRPDRISHLHVLPVISWAAARAGLFQIHAACVRGKAGAVLVAGKSGSGKSTLARAFAASGAEAVSDDRTLLFLEDGRAFASASHERPNPFCLWAGIDPRDVIENRVPLPRLHEDAPPGPVPLAGLVFPEVAANEESELTPLRPPHAAARLLSGYFFSDRPPEAVMALVEAAARLPAFSLKSGKGLDGLSPLWDLLSPSSGR